MLSISHSHAVMMLACQHPGYVRTLPEIPCPVPNYAAFSSTVLVSPEEVMSQYGEDVAWHGVLLRIMQCDASICDERVHACNSFACMRTAYGGMERYTSMLLRVRLRCVRMRLCIQTYASCMGPIEPLTFSVACVRCSACMHISAYSSVHVQQCMHICLQFVCRSHQSTTGALHGSIC